LDYFEHVIEFVDYTPDPEHVGLGLLGFALKQVEQRFGPPKHFGMMSV